MTIMQWFSLIFCISGLFFFMAGTVGLIRFPNILSRLHALTKIDNLGLGLILIGLIPQTSSVNDALKLILIWVLVIFSSSACSYLIASRALHHPPPSPQKAKEKK